MADDNQTTTATTAIQELNVPEEVQNKFPELIQLIKQSQSMNQEERQYWVDVLPIMSEEQVENLKNILDNEKKQIEEANRKFEKGMKKNKFNLIKRFDEIKYKEKKKILYETEKQHELEEKEHEEALLKELNNM